MIGLGFNFIILLGFIVLCKVNKGLIVFFVLKIICGGVICFLELLLVYIIYLLNVNVDMFFILLLFELRINFCCIFVFY